MTDERFPAMGFTPALPRRTRDEGVRRPLAILWAAAVSAAAVPAAAVPAAAMPAAHSQARPGGALPSIEERTAGMAKMDGFFPIYWDEAEGKLFLQIPLLDTEVLYIHSLPAGIGSNDIGLDRGQLGRSRVVLFHRVGRRVLMVEPNYRYRAESPDPDERRAVEESFARSILWGFEVVAESPAAAGSGRGGGAGARVLVEATEFVLRDAHDVVGTLRRRGQGNYRLDPSRSALYLPRTKAFPDNTEIEVVLTFTTGDDPGPWVRSVVPTAEAVTVRQRHSLVRLPGPGYTPRPADPRAGFGTVAYVDYAAPLGEPIVRHFIRRHRLHKRDPAAAVSKPVEPIIYYVDRGTPEPVRSALMEGASWWNEAFEAAGYRDAFRVELLPEGADPMDVRYNVIQWVHRSTRGWSYGGSVTDPRTGEIIKGHVTLGSLRVRQDYLIAEGLLSPYRDGGEMPPELAEMALARIRQLAAHEVGHTLGLAHNYVASAQGRASVMDYPHPLVRIGEDGSIDLSDAYAVGIGEWDMVAIRYGYEDFPEGTDEAAALERILAEARERGITFVTDRDARPAGSAHPQAHLWDNGVDAVAELERVMGVRRAALRRFGEAAVRRGTPLARMEEALVPLYLHHRYQVEAAVKVLGGLRYTYALRGDGQQPLEAVPAEEQRRALDALLRTLDPEALAVPGPVLQTLPPRPPLHPAHRELFPRYTGLVFDAVSPAVVAADLTVSLILNPERAARLVEQHAIDARMPGLGEVIDRLVAATFGPGPGHRRGDGYRAEIARAVQRVVAERLMALAASAPMGQVRAVATLKLVGLRDALEAGIAAARTAAEADRAHALLLAQEIGRFLERPGPPAGEVPRLQAPPGSPIGSAEDWLRWAEPGCAEWQEPRGHLGGGG